MRYPLPQSPALAPPLASVQGPYTPLPQASQPPGVAQAATAVMPAPPAPPVAPQPVLFEPGQIMARVGDKTILYCDVAPTVNMIMAPALAKCRNEMEREAVEGYRDQWTRNVVEQQIQNKMLLLEFERGMPSEIRKDAKKRAESEAKMNKAVRNAFEQTLAGDREKLATANPEETEKIVRQDGAVARLAVLMKENKLESQGELDLLLRQYGTSLQAQMRDFGEYMMGMEAARTNLGLNGKSKKGKQEVTHIEMLDFYKEHLADYYIPAKARFEILTVKFANFGGDRAAAWDFLARMGNEVVVGGTPFAAVARKHSQEPHASEGGYYDWVNPGSLASKPLDRAVFSIEVGKMSQPIEDEDGYHILRVMERKDAGQVSFQEAQPKIKEAIERQRQQAAQQEYLTKLRDQVKVWRIYDEPTEVASQPGETQQR
jgi:parvulin-like peptidyl-prolyl isomerase